MSSGFSARGGCTLPGLPPMPPTAGALGQLCLRAGRGGVFPEPYAAQLAANPLAAQWFDQATPSYRTLVVHWVLSAKQQATRDRRMAQVIDDSAHGRLIPTQRYGEEPRWVARNRAALGILLALVLALVGCTTGGGTGGIGSPGVSGSGAGGSSSSAAGSSSNPSSPTVTTTARPPANWVEVENANPGDDGWNISTSQTAPEGTLDGYADAASVAPGESVRLFLSSTRGPVTVTCLSTGVVCRGRGPPGLVRSRGDAPSSQPQPGSPPMAW
jgi:hypothetical protein